MEVLYLCHVKSLCIKNSHKQQDSNHTNIVALSPLDEMRDQVDYLPIATSNKVPVDLKSLHGILLVKFHLARERWDQFQFTCILQFYLPSVNRNLKSITMHAKWL
jgi:hypothetical protein